MIIRYFLFLMLSAFLWGSCSQSSSLVKREQKRVLLISRPALADSSRFTHTYRQLTERASPSGIEIDSTTRLDWLTEDTLKSYSALVLLEVEPDGFAIWNQADLERYVQAGGGLVSLNNPEPLPFWWPWYTQIDTLGISRTVESPNPPLFHRYAFDRGRIARLKDRQVYERSGFADSLVASIDHAIGANRYDYSLARSPEAPRFYQFTKLVLDDDINEPMELAVTPEGKVVFIERRGLMKLYDPLRDTTPILSEFDVCLDRNYEDGLLGLALDPSYGKENNWLCLYYSPPCDTLYQFLSRFEFRGDSLDRAPEKVMLRVGVQRETYEKTNYLLLSRIRRKEM